MEVPSTRQIPVDAQRRSMLLMSTLYGDDTFYEIPEVPFYMNRKSNNEQSAPLVGTIKFTVRVVEREERAPKNFYNTHATCQMHVLEIVRNDSPSGDWSRSWILSLFASQVFCSSRKVTSFRLTHHADSWVTQEACEVGRALIMAS